jgi:hypothetical protein
MKSWDKQKIGVSPRSCSHFPALFLAQAWRSILSGVCVVLLLFCALYDGHVSDDVRNTPLYLRSASPLCSPDDPWLAAASCIYYTSYLLTTWLLYPNLI